MKYPLFLLLLMVSSVLHAQIDPSCSRMNAHQGSSKNLQAVRALEDIRLHDYDVHFYHLDISASNASISLTGTVRIMASVVSEEMTEFVVELADELTVSGVTVGGFSASVTQASDLVIITLDRSYTQGEMLDVEIDYGGTPPLGDGFFQGIQSALAPEWNQRVTWTLSEPFNARDWWPVKQVLTDKADSAYIYITVPEGQRVGASGILKDVADAGNGQVQFQWQTDQPIAYYLISMAISDYTEYNTEVSLPGVSEPVQILNYIYNNPAALSEYKDLMDGVGDQLLLFSELFGTYPYSNEKYGHAMAPMGGGMEHQTMSTMSTFTFRLIAHELAHQWYGDRITCATWSDIWINEGFARYSEYLALEFLQNRESADAWMKLLQDNVISQPTGSVYVPELMAKDPYRIFNGRLTYNKGGAILHTLRYLINNDDLFFQGMENYADAYADQTATGADFRDFMEQETGIPLDNFFEEWYFGEGYPIYDITWWNRNDSLIFDVSQETSSPTKTPFFSTEIPIGFIQNGEEKIVRLQPGQNDEQFKIYAPGIIDDLQFDPEGYLIKSVSFRNGDITSVEDARSAGFRIFPNPASNELTVLLPSNGSWSLQMFDIHGRLHHELPASNRQQWRIPVSGLPPGLYYIEAVNRDRRYRIKAVVHH